MKTIRDLTRRQALEIATLIYPFDDGIKSEIDFQYQSKDPSWCNDAREFAKITFKGITFGDTVDDLLLEINANLDCYLYYCREDGAFSLPSRNQHAIQKKFIEWGIEPLYETIEK